MNGRWVGVHGWMSGWVVLGIVECWVLWMGEWVDK